MELIFVGYTMKPREGVEALMPQFTHNKGTKDEDKQRQQIEEKKARWLEGVSDTPYLAELDTVCLAIPRGANSPAKTYKAAGRGGDSGKPSLAKAVRAFLVKEYPTERWPALEDTRAERPAMFVGFNPRLFLKTLGLECCSSLNKAPLPLGMWYGNTDHRDLAEALIPTKECKDMVTWHTVKLFYRIGLGGEQLAQYDKLMEGWNGPGLDAEKDVAVALYFGARLGMV